MRGPVQDPALIDRRLQSVIGVAEGDLPSRSMTIAGLEGRIEARILSKDLSGPATRLARIPDGWGSGVVGAFTADVELFVIGGELVAAGERLGQYDYGAARAGQVISGLRARATTLALIMTSAPVRYDTSVGGMLSDPLIGTAATTEWRSVPELPGRFVRPLAEGPHGAVWLSGAREWTNEDGPWHVHDSAEEMFVLEGEFTIAEDAEVAEVGAPPRSGREQPRTTDTYRCGPGSYTYRLPGRPHAGPGSASSDLAIAFHRMHAPGVTTWIESEPATDR